VFETAPIDPRRSASVAIYVNPELRDSIVPRASTIVGRLPQEAGEQVLSVITVTSGVISSPEEQSGEVDRRVKHESR